MPPEGWRALVAGAESMDSLKAVYERANSERWATDEVVKAINARKAELS